MLFFVVTVKSFLNVNKHFAVNVNEPHFFDVLHRYRQGVEYYKKHMSLSTRDQTTVEGNILFENYSLSNVPVVTKNSSIQSNEILSHKWYSELNES